MTTEDAHNWTIHKNFFLNHLRLLPKPYASQESSRLTLAYFVISALDLLGAIDKVDAKETIDWIYSLQILPASNDEGQNNALSVGWRGSPAIGFPYNPQCKASGLYSEYDQGHVAMTYVALGLLLMLGDDFSRVNKSAIIGGLKGLRRDDGSISAMSSGSESDMRYVYCACAISYMLNDWSDELTNFIVSSQSYDGAIGQCPYEEAHGGSTYCAIAALALMGRLHNIPNKEQLIYWLVQRQQFGFNGRPNKIQDTCYSFWVGASLMMLGGFDLVVYKHNRSYTMSCEKHGGFGKWPDTFPDVLHSYFSLCGLSFMSEPGISSVNPAIGFSNRAHDRLINIHGPQFQIVKLSHSLE